MVLKFKKNEKIENCLRDDTSSCKIKLSKFNG